MSTIETVVTAMTATAAAGTLIAEQSGFVSELKDKIEEIVGSAKSIKTTVEQQRAVQGQVSEYFEKFIDFLASNESPHKAQDNIKSTNDELIESTSSIMEKLEEFIEQVNACIEKAEEVGTALSEAVDKTNDVAGMISETASN